MAGVEALEVRISQRRRQYIEMALKHLWWLWAASRKPIRSLVMQPRSLAVRLLLFDEYAKLPVRLATFFLLNVLEVGQQEVNSSIVFPPVWRGMVHDGC